MNDEIQMPADGRVIGIGSRSSRSKLRILSALISGLTVLVAGFSTVGCSGSKVAPVLGHITLDGKPLANVHVSFQPIAKPGEMQAGSGSYAVTDAEGKFALLLVHGEKPGAFIGKHRVAITAKSEAPPDNVDFARRPPPKVFVPAKYGANGDLNFEVPPGGTSTADFNLKSQP